MNFTGRFATISTIFALASFGFSNALAGDADKPFPQPQQNKSSVPFTDTVHDVHFENHCTMEKSGIDMSDLFFSIQNEALVVEMHVDAPILTLPGYREYYLWIDTNQGLKNSGFVPYDSSRMASGANFVYNADVHAWRDFFADYRVLFSVDNNGGHSTSQLFQTCALDNCASDQAFYSSREWFAVETGDKMVRFSIPLTRIGVSSSGQTLQIGATTYANRDNCSAEDDASNWGQHAIQFGL